MYVLYYIIKLIVGRLNVYPGEHVCVCACVRENERVRAWVCVCERVSVRV